MATHYTPPVTGTGLRATIQRFGGFLAGMVMPNIAAFIAWGLITAMFIPTGWWPNETMAQLVDPMIMILLPVLIGYTGGRIVHGQRGAVVGAVATVGVVVGSDAPMFLGAMIIGPAAAFLLKQFDRLIQDRVKPGFEMLIDNFSAGIIGGAMALFALWGVGPVARAITTAAGNGVDWLIANNLLPVASVLVEPAKVLFLNNAINHGVLGPLGVAQSAEDGQSILFMIESNPGPGLGLLMAFMFFGPHALRPTVPAAAVVHFLGGIHEIYFPYVLMKPRLILAVIAGGASGVLTFLITGAGLVATPSPGSIFAYMAVTPRGGHVWVLLGIIVSAAVSFVVAAALLGFGKLEKRDPDPEPAVEPASTGSTGTASTAQPTSSAVADTAASNAGKE
ncbi:PTS mannitol transporter subunit IICB [Natronosporangium hydrolyticum]|uniref:PTS mannitol transporter subunit IICB n=1 Tax=Natronosporangium hydrolyticum TaxID=2811111 RepID=A0A895Y658_9ACTN|nr:PTS mannitol transporter subunit IICB [Natronosporangium hydrolyticum]QSB13227.1 PTS mannitol transporter subunit IICB [Natronosporangium hydrolyticum]